MKHAPLALILCLLASPALAQDAPDMEITLTPAAPGDDGFVRRLDVAIRFEQAGTTPSLIEMPITRHTVPTSATGILGFALTDDEGFLPNTVQDETLDDADQTRKWTPERAPQGTVTIAYSVRIDPDLPELARPQYEMRTRNGVFSGAGLSFLPLPADDVARNVTLRWNLSAMPKGAVGLSSLGTGSLTSTEPLTPADLASSYFMAGTLHSYRKDNFFAGWDSPFAFDGSELMQWAADLQEFYGDFFQIRPEHFGVFARVNTANPGSGIGLKDSFAFTYDEAMGPDEPKNLLAHEMLHAWVNSLDRSMDQVDGFASSWFGEGLAVHYQRLLPYRAGLISAEQFLQDLNSTAGRYYTNIMMHVPNDQIGAGFWKDTRIRVLPYDRGSLYFAKVDAQIRAASDGKRSLDDIVRAMLQEREAGRPMDLPLWKRLLEAELGQQGIDEFEAMLTGAEVVVPADAFGPCFTRVSTPLRRFDLGFAPASLLTPERKVSGLKPGSNAEMAGLRDGDRILNSFSQDGLQGDQTRTLDLKIVRGDDTLSISYKPRGEEVPAWQWISQNCGDKAP